MRRVRFLFLLLLAALVLAARPGPSGRRPMTTVEPTLPLRMDLRIEAISPSGADGRARLSFAIEADAVLEDLALALHLPEGLRASEGLPSGPFRMAAGERRFYDLTIVVPQGGRLPVRVEAEYHLEDGRTLRSGQGIDLPIGAPPAGRSSAGALEFFAVPAGEIGR